MPALLAYRCPNVRDSSEAYDHKEHMSKLSLCVQLFPLQSCTETMNCILPQNAAFDDAAAGAWQSAVKGKH